MANPARVMANPARIDKQSLEALAAYHNDAIDSLSHYLQARYEDGDIRFLGYSRADFRRFVSSRLDETELRSSLMLLAKVEAALRVDFRTRVLKRKSKDALSKAFVALRRSKPRRARLDDLLALWIVHHPEVKRLASELRAALKYRHWLAHGRYWERPANGKFDYQTLYNLADAIADNFPFAMEATDAR